VLGTNTEVKLANAAAARFCNVHETSITGRTLEALGARWDKQQMQNAVMQAIRDNRTVTVSGLRMPDSEDRDIELRIYPLEGKSRKKPDGVVLYGVRLSRDITELIHENTKKVGELTDRQTRLERSEKYFREMIRDMNDSLFILDGAGRIEWSNGAAKKLLSSDSKGFQGQRFHQLVSENYRNAFEQITQRALDTGVFLPPAEMILETPGGKKYVEISFSRAASHDGKNKLVITLREVPPERLMERSAAQSVVRDAAQDRDRMERRIRFLSGALDALPIAVAITELDGRIIQANQAFGKMFHQKREAFSGKSITSVHAGDSKFLTLGITAQVGEQRMETKLKPMSGAAFTAEAWAVPLSQGPSGKKALICAFRETGAQRAAAEKEKRAVRATTLSAASRDIAHRLHAPVAGVIQSLQQLGGNLFSDETRDIWQNAMRGGMTLNQSVNMMLMYANEQPLETTVCDMNAIVSETLDTLKQYKMLPRGLNIAFHANVDVPACQADPEQMKMVLWNLIMNAAQAVEGRPDAEVKINVFNHNTQGRDMMVVDIKDSGPEFDLKDVSLFFQPFCGRREGGVGLGLTLSKRAIERHGGRIGVERKNGCTHVGFAFPLTGGPDSRRTEALTRSMN
jgi:PAS domain S-box-containing protein